MYRCCNKKCCTCNNEEISPIDESCMDVQDTDCECNCCCNANNNGGCSCSYNNMSECACGFDEQESVFPLNPMLGQSYVPMQKMTNVFTPICGLKNGSLFPELVSPYYPCQSVEDIEYLKSIKKKALEELGSLGIIDLNNTSLNEKAQINKKIIDMARVKK